MSRLLEIVRQLRESRGFRHKQDIASVLARLDPGTSAPAGVPNGDDSAVLPLPGGQGYQLLAIEGLVPDFVQALPWFAGYSAVMVNLSDIAAMGGRPQGVVDALWACDDEQAGELLAGMRAAAERYEVPIIGGHTNLRAAQGHLAVAVLGYARELISSFAARPGDRILVATDLRGGWQGAHPFWDASTDANPQQLRGDLDILPRLAEDGLCLAGKDISMAGVLGSLLMLLECSRAGASVELERLPRPREVPAWSDDSAVAVQSQMRWLNAFPSFGFVLSVSPRHAEAVIQRFADRHIACSDVGVVVARPQLRVHLRGEEALLWDLGSQPFIGVGPTCGAKPSRIAA